MAKIFEKIVGVKNYAFKHKIISAIAIIILIFIGYYGVKKITSTAGETKYVVAYATKGTLISSISGTGQVSASNQIDIKSKVSGDVVSVNVVSGQEVKAGTIIASLDARDAEISLENAKIALAKLTAPADSVTKLQTQNALEDAKASIQKSYDTAFSAIVSANLDMPDIISGMDDLLYGKTGYLNDNQSSFTDSARSLKNSAGIKYDRAKSDYQSSLTAYKALSATSDSVTLKSAVISAYGNLKNMSEALKDAKSAVELLKNQKADTSSAVTTAENNLSSWINKISTDVGNLSSAKDGIDSSERDLKTKNEALVKLQNGSDPLDIESAQLSVRQKEYAYEDYFIRAPFDGVVANLNVKKTDSISSGTSLGAFLTKQKIAEISLNEVDVAKVKAGQKVTLTFDAVPDLTISGSVAEVDLVGTVSQGVVTYNVKIGFDTEDDRVKSGMSVSASIITDVKQDVILVPNSAVKTSGNTSTVAIFDNKISDTNGNQGTPSTVAPREQVVEIGSSNDTSTEIISGIKEGDQIVTRTIAGTGSGATTSSAPSLLGAVGGRTGGASGVRAGGAGR